MWIESGIFIGEPGEAPQKEASTGQQYQRERNLCSDEQAPEARLRAVACITAS